MTRSKPDERQTQDQAESEQAEACRIEPGTSPLALFLWLLAFHVLLACVTLTYFQPDETWQSLEIAHRHQFGYGYETWEWRDQRTGPAQTWSELLRAACMQGKWKEVLSELAKGPLRSKLYPVDLSSAYSILRMLDLDGNFWALTLFPRIFQAGLSTVTAWSTFWLARFISRGENMAWASLFSLLASPYYLYTACRAFSNNSEAALSTLALMAFAQPRSGFDPNLVMSVGFAAYACLIRPTNALLWVFVYGQAIVRGTLLSVKRPSALLNLAAFVSLLALIGCLSLAFLAVIDSCWAGRPSLSVVPFVTQNILESIAIFYGANPWHWYITQGLPVTCMAALPFVVIGAWRMARNGSQSERLHVGSLLWVIAGLSLLSHKEWRFLQPTLPLMHVCAGKALASDGPKQQQQQSGRDHHNTALTKIWSSISSTKRVLLLAPFPLTIYLLLFHGIAQSWTLPLYTRQEHAAGRLHSLGLLMPCHSTPWQSHFHLKELGGNANKDSRLWFLTCEPPRLSDDRTTYQDESDFFYDDPVRFLRMAFPTTVDTSFPASRWWDRERDPDLFLGGSDLSEASPQSPPHEWPSHLALFEALLQHPRYGTAVADLLHSKGYLVERTMFNSLFHDDPRRRGRIVVMRYSEDI